MSTSVDVTQYAVQISYGSTSVAVQVNVTVNASDAFGDSNAFSLYDALVAAFPAAWNVGASASVSKSASQVTNYTTDTASTPPSFT